MTTGIILIIATLVLGGVIASVGDRIGTKVGKARLSLFNLRPKKTAVLVTLLTGSLISGSTLAVLFAASEQLRTGVFKLEEIQRNLKNARREIERTKVQKSQVESELTRAKTEQAIAQQRLDTTNQSLQVALGKLSEAVAKQARTETQLNQTQSHLSRTQNQLNQTQKELNQTQSQLNQTLGELTQTQNQLKTVSEQVMALRVERQSLIGQRDQLQAERQTLIGQRDQLQTERQTLIGQRDQLQTERQTLIGQRDQLKAEITNFKAQIAARDQALAQQDQAIAQLDQKISLRDQVIAQRETKLKELENQQKELESKQVYLQKAVTVLEEYYQDYQALREGNLVLFRSQVLASGVVRIVDPSAARQAVDQLLLTANRTAIENTRPGDRRFNQQVIKITQAEVDGLVSQISDGRDYVVRILSAGNYVRGESAVQVFVDVTPNRLVFKAGEVVATTSTEPAKMTEEQLLRRIDQLIAASQFRANRAGIVADKIQIGDGRIETLMRFIEQLKQSDESVDVQAITTDVTYTSGPVKMDLVAIHKGQVIFRTASAS